MHKCSHLKRHQERLLERNISLFGRRSSKGSWRGNVENPPQAVFLFAEADLGDASNRRERSRNRRDNVLSNLVRRERFRV